MLPTRRPCRDPRKTIMLHHGFLRVAAASPVLRVADCAFNAEHILALMRRAEAEGVAVLVFPELSLTGYTCADLFQQPVLQRGALDALEHVSQGRRRPVLRHRPRRPAAGRGRSGLQLRRRPAPRPAARPRAQVVHPQLQGVLRAPMVRRRRHRPQPAKSSSSASAVPFGADRLFAADDVEGLTLGVEICEDLWVPVPPSSHQALAGATRARQPVGQQRGRSARPPTAGSSSSTSPAAAWPPTSTPPAASANRPPTWFSAATVSSPRTARCWPNRAASSATTCCSPPTWTSTASAPTASAPTASATPSSTRRPGSRIQLALPFGVSARRYPARRAAPADRRPSVRAQGRRPAARALRGDLPDAGRGAGQAARTHRQAGGGHRRFRRPRFDAGPAGGLQDDGRPRRAARAHPGLHAARLRHQQPHARQRPRPDAPPRRHGPRGGHSPAVPGGDEGAGPSAVRHSTWTG